MWPQALTEGSFDNRRSPRRAAGGASAVMKASVVAILPLLLLGAYLPVAYADVQFTGIYQPSFNPYVGPGLPTSGNILNPAEDPGFPTSPPSALPLQSFEGVSDINVGQNTATNVQGFGEVTIGANTACAIKT